jgi:hypothetical protein
MRFGLVVLGIILLVIGGVLYYNPSQTFSAQTDSSVNGASNPRTSSAMFNIPVVWSYALLIMGALFLLLGLVISGPAVMSGPVKIVSSGIPGPRGPRGSRGKTQVRTPVRAVNQRPHSVVRRSRRMVIPQGTSVTTTTTTARR